MTVCNTRFAGSTITNKGAFATKCRFISITTVRSGKIVPYKLSDIGEGIHEVTVKEWFVKPGDRVSQFDNICEVQSDKASVTITSRYDGLVKTLHHRVDDVARVGGSLVDIELDEDNREENANEAQPSRGEQCNGKAVVENVETAADDRPTPVAHRATSGKCNKVLTTPAVRRLALERNIDLAKVIPSGRNGRIMKEDVLEYLRHPKRDSQAPGAVAAALASATSADQGEIRPLKGYTKHMYRTMTQSLSIPHFVYSDECDVTKLALFRNEVKENLEKRGISLSFMPFFVKAASKALEQFPELNAWLDEESQSLRTFPHHNISIAMDTPQGLVVPNIKNVQELGIVQIAKELNRLQTHGRTASMPPNDLSGGTFSLSNIGVVGGTYTKPVILRPQVAIGALGRIQRVPRFDAQDKVIPVNLLSISWAADHRVVDGMTMARFSNLWRQYVENPSHLILGSISFLTALRQIEEFREILTDING